VSFEEAFNLGLLGVGIAGCLLIRWRTGIWPWESDRWDEEP
jgi:hypothetical protein